MEYASAVLPLSPYVAINLFLMSSRKENATCLLAIKAHKNDRNKRPIDHSTHRPNSSSATHIYVRPSKIMMWKMCLSQTYDIRLSVGGIFSRIFRVILAKFPTKNRRITIHLKLLLETMIYEKSTAPDIQD
jgi:hypothetical protein